MSEGAKPGHEKLTSDSTTTGAVPPPAAAAPALFPRSSVALVSLIGALLTGIAALVGPLSEWVQQSHKVLLAQEQQHHVMRLDFLKQLRETHSSPDQRRDVLRFYAEVLEDEQLKTWASKQLKKEEQRADERATLRKRLVEARTELATLERIRAEAEFAAAQAPAEHLDKQKNLRQAELESAKGQAKVREKLQALEATREATLPLSQLIQVAPMAPPARHYVQISAISGTNGDSLTRKARGVAPEFGPVSVFANQDATRHFLVLGPYPQQQAEDQAASWRATGGKALVTSGGLFSKKLYASGRPR